MAVTYRRVFACVLVVGALVAVGSFATPAKAQLRYLADSPGYCGASPYSLGQIPVPPYFSLHPPVYYSVPVPRTYGYSPYAYPGTVKTPDLKRRPQPKTVINPYFNEEGKRTIQAKATPKTTATGTTVTPLVILNPYFDQQSKVVPAGYTAHVVE